MKTTVAGLGLVFAVGCSSVPGPALDDESLGASQAASTTSTSMTTTILVSGAGPSGGPHVKVFDAKTKALKSEWFAFAPTMNAGLNVAAGNVLSPTRTDVVVAGRKGSTPLVRIFGQDGVLKKEWSAYDPGFSGGVNVAVGDIDGDGRQEVITGAGPGGGPHVKVWDASTTPPTVVREFFAYAASFTGGVNVAAGDFDGDGKADVVTGAGPGGAPHVRVLSGATGAELYGFFAPLVYLGSVSDGWKPYQFGVKVGVGTDGSGNPAVLVGGTELRIFLRTSTGGSPDCPPFIAGPCFTRTAEFIAMPVVQVLRPVSGALQVVSQITPDYAGVNVATHGTPLTTAQYLQTCFPNNQVQCNGLSIPSQNSGYNQRPDYSISVAGARIDGNTPVMQLVMGSPPQGLIDDAPLRNGVAPYAPGMMRVSYFATPLWQTQPYGVFNGGESTAADVVPLAN